MLCERVRDQDPAKHNKHDQLLQATTQTGGDESRTRHRYPKDVHVHRARSLRRPKHRTRDQLHTLLVVQSAVPEFSSATRPTWINQIG